MISFSKQVYDHITSTMKVGDRFTSIQVAASVGCKVSQASAAFPKMVACGMIKAVARCASHAPNIRRHAHIFEYLEVMDIQYQKPHGLNGPRSRQTGYFVDSISRSLPIEEFGEVTEDPPSIENVLKYFDEAAEKERRAGFYPAVRIQIGDGEASSSPPSIDPPQPEFTLADQLMEIAAKVEAMENKKPSIKDFLDDEIYDEFFLRFSKHRKK